MFRGHGSFVYHRAHLLLIAVSKGFRLQERSQLVGALTLSQRMLFPHY